VRAGGHRAERLRPRADALGAPGPARDIVRDSWGIAHVRGHSDADAVFGMVYAQAEDDFQPGRDQLHQRAGPLAEGRGRVRAWADLRMKLFIDPDALRAPVCGQPGVLRALMDAWADGLNYYLATHPAVVPRVIARFEPWMALSFTQGSIGGDIERVDLGQLAAFYGDGSTRPAPPRGQRVDRVRAVGEAVPGRSHSVADRCRRPEGPVEAVVAPRQELRVQWRCGVGVGVDRVVRRVGAKRQRLLVAREVARLVCR